jgi:hypothetical protein
MRNYHVHICVAIIRLTERTYKVTFNNRRRFKVVKKTFINNTQTGYNDEYKRTSTTVQQKECTIRDRLQGKCLHRTEQKKTCIVNLIPDPSIP